MPIRSFVSVPEDIRDWGRFFRETTVTADVVAPNTVDTAMLVNGAVTNAKLRDSAALSVLGRPVNSGGDPSDISFPVDLTVLRRSGAVIGAGSITSAYVSDFNEACQDAALAALTDSSEIDWTYNDGAGTASASIVAGSIATGKIADDNVTNAKLADMAEATMQGRAAGAGTGDPGPLIASQIATIVSAAVASALNIISGTYTPTLTNDANLGASTAYQCQYLRVGGKVIVSGKVDVDPTLTATSTQLRISLPIASNFGADEDCAGTAFASGIAVQGAAILADSANAAARMQWVATDVSNQPMYFVFLYDVI